MKSLPNLEALLIGLAAVALVALGTPGRQSGVNGALGANHGAPEGVSSAEARRRIEAHIARLDGRLSAMNALYKPGAAVQTLKAEMQKRGVGFGMRYADTWGSNSIFTRWDDADEFYGFHLQALRQSLNALPNSDVSSGDLAYLDRGVSAWSEQEQRLKTLFEQLVQVYVRYGLSADKKSAAGVTSADRDHPLIAEEKQIEADSGRILKEMAEIRNKRLFEAIKSWQADPQTVSNPPTPAATPTAMNESEDCRKLKAERERLKKELEELNAFVLPEDQVRELNILLKEAVEALGGTGGDTEKTVAKLDEILKVLDAKKSKFGAFIKRLRDGLKSGAQKINAVKEVLEKVQAWVEQAERNFDAAEGGSAKDQVKTLKETFDRLKRSLPVDEVPGLGDLLNAYSEAIDRIADSVGKLEEARRRQEEEYRKTGLEGEILIKPKTRREQLADAKTRLRDKLAELDEKIAEACARTPDGSPPTDPCLRPGNRVNVALQNAFKKAAPEARQRDLAKKELDAVLEKSGPLKNKLVGIREELVELKSKLPTGGSKGNPALRRKLEAQIREKERERADLEREIAGLSAEYRRKLEIYFKTVRDWQDAVKKWLKRAADAQKWTAEDYRHLQDCHATWVF